MRHVLIIIPTYNEVDTIGPLLAALVEQKELLKERYVVSILIIDDDSPDGTAAIVKRYGDQIADIYLLQGHKQGLGVAYKRGIAYALTHLFPDIVVTMDADFSHTPEDILRLLQRVEEGNDIVIGSRYTEGGTIPQDWPQWRKANSRIANYVARYLAGIIRIKDATSGFRAISVACIQRMNFGHVRSQGFAFQMSFLAEALAQGARVSEIPIHFIDRVKGASKMRVADIIEFIFSAFSIRFLYSKFSVYQGLTVALAVFGAVGVVILMPPINASELLPIAVVGISALLTIHGVLSVVWMLYAWEDPDRVSRNNSPVSYDPAQHFFTALIPARHEQRVIGDTLAAIASIHYPSHLNEALVICRADDYETITAVHRAINALADKNIRLIVFDDLPINKPHALNIGLREARGDSVVVFDAEDEPHPDIYHIANTVMLRDGAQVIQSGVQLMNFRSHWFSSFNVLEYFFWFKSTLHFFAARGFTPLAGNTVFFDRTWLEAVGGWDESCLTEDADIGIRLSIAGAKMRVIYDERHATQEETPASMESFMRQRTRWNQGFMQVFLKGDWRRLPKMSQKVYAAYLLLVPQINGMMVLYVPLSLITMLNVKMSLPVALFSMIPLYLLVFQQIVNMAGLYEFTRQYQLRFSWALLPRMILTFYPFQLLLSISALRALWRMALHDGTWEKTAHVNAHRAGRMSEGILAQEEAKKVRLQPI